MKPPRSHPQPNSAFQRVRYDLTAASLLRLDAVAANETLAPLISELELEAFDFQSEVTDENVFKERLRTNFLRDVKISRQYKPKGTKFMDHRAFRQEATLEAHWQETRGLYEQNQLLRYKGCHARVAAHAIRAMINLKAITLRRLHGLSRSKFAVEDLSPDLTDTLEWRSGVPSTKSALQRPIYWQTFADLARVALEKPAINAARLYEVSEDLSLTSRTGLDDMSKLLGQVEHLEIFPCPDTLLGRPRCRESSSQKRREFSQAESQAWRDLLGKARFKVQSLVLALGHGHCNVHTSRLLRKLLLLVEWPNLESLELCRMKLCAETFHRLLGRVVPSSLKSFVLEHCGTDGISDLAWREALQALHDFRLLENSQLSFCGDGGSSRGFLFVILQSFPPHFSQ